MAWHGVRDVRAAVDDYVWDSLLWSSGNIEMEPAFWGTNQQEGEAAANRPYDPAIGGNLGMHREAADADALARDFDAPVEPDDYEPDLDYDTGGRQPGIEFSLPGSKAESPSPWYEISLFDPFRFAFHGLKVPVLGVMSVIIERTKTVGVVVYSLLYMSLPTLAWFLGVDKNQYVLMRYDEYRPVPAGGDWDELERCEECAGWNVIGGLPAFHYLRNPFLQCHHRVRESTSQPFTGALALSPEEALANACLYDGYAGLIAKFQLGDLCDHDDEPHNFSGDIPHSTPDGLYGVKPRQEYRGHCSNNGLRCSAHFPEHIQFWHPGLYKQVFVEKNKVPARAVFRLVRMLVDWNEFLSRYTKGAHILLTALTLDRVRNLQPHDGHVIVLYNEDGLPAAVRSKLSSTQLPDYQFFRVPQFGGHGRFLASVRVVLAYFANAPVTISIVNQKFLYTESVYINHIKGSPYSSVSGTGAHTVPAYCGSLTIKGRHGIDSYMPALASLYWGGLVYGWDEIYPVEKQKNLCVVYKALATPAIVLDTTFPRTKGPETALMITAETEHRRMVAVLPWTRQGIYWVDRLAGSDVDPGRLTFWHVWADPRPVIKQGARAPESIRMSRTYTRPDRKWYTEYECTDVIPEPSRIIAPGDHILQELVASLGGLRFFVLGTKGDVLPFRALAKHIADYGVPVSLVKLNDSEEGRLMLAAALGKTEGEGAVQLFNRARTQMLENLTAASVVHSALMTGDVPTLDLTPPPDLISTRTVGGSWIMSLGSALLGVWYAPSARIGPYTGQRVVPTSHDGERFLVAKQNRHKIKYGAVWGSDNEPAPGYEHIPLVPDGDHLELFRDYSNIVCHGGAGTVSTAAAAGCRVIVPVGGLDRTRRNPYDAGLGLVPGADPDNIFLVLADHDIRFLAFWLRKNMWRPWKLWSFYGFPGLGWACFRCIMLYTLYNSSFKDVPVSSEPIAVLVGVLGGRVSTWASFVVLTVLSKAVDMVLDYLNISYLRVLSSFVDYNLRMATSPVALFIAVKYNIGYGLVYSMASPWLYRFASHTFQAYVNVVLGVAPYSKPDGEHHDPVYLELSPRFYNGFPVIHSALVCPMAQERYEGHIQNGLYIMSCKPGQAESAILLPTTLVWRDVQNLPHLAGRYSLAWNCQTAIIIALNKRYVSLGPGGIFLYVSSTVSAGVYAVIAGGMTALWSIISMVPRTLSPSTARPPEFDFAGDILTSLWNRLSVTGEWDPVAVLSWWRTLLLPF